MNETQKQALKEYHTKLMKDLELDADLVSKFIHHGLFNEDMIEDFKSESTRKGQVQKMLLKLPRRGPRAFEFFLLSLQDHYSWLADGLKEVHANICNKKDSDHMTVREKVDIFVHEHFGNSKRFCEDDKKQIKKFLYKHLKEHDELVTNLDNGEYLQEEKQALEKEIESQVCQKVMALLDKKDNSDDSDNDSIDSFDVPVEYSIDMIERKVNELNASLESYEKEIQSCFNVLGLQNCEYSLHDVLETYAEKRSQEHEELVVMKEKLTVLEKRRSKLQEKLYNKEHELKMCMSNLANMKLENEKKDLLLKELHDRCAKLKQLHVEHVEKQKTLMTLKNMVNDLSPLQRARQEQPMLPMQVDSYDEPDGHVEHLHLPDLPATRSSTTRPLRQSHTRRSNTRITAMHHDFPTAGNRPATGKPWK